MMKKQSLVIIGILTVLVALILVGGCVQKEKKPDLEKNASDTLKLTIIPVDARTEEVGVYLFEKNESFKIKVMLENKGKESVTILTPSGQTVFDKVFYFQILDVNGMVLETDTRLITMLAVAAIGPEKVLLQPNEKHSFFAYINSNVSSKEDSIEHHHFDTNLVRKFLDIGFDERYYKIKGIYDTTGYGSRKNYEDINEVLLYSNDIMIEVIE